MGGKRVTKDERERMVEMRNNGMTVAMIAEKMNRSIPVVYVTLNKVDFTMTKKPTEPVVVLDNPNGNILDNFTPLYKRVKYLNKQKKEIEEELRNIRATLQNAIEIIDTGDLAEPIRTWGAIDNGDSQGI